MGGYAFYVWSAYGVTFIVLLINFILPVLQRHRFFRQQVLKQKRQKS
ncbi:MAG: heme exporter protein CcmD [Methylococcaceae bacterium]